MLMESGDLPSSKGKRMLSLAARFLMALLLVFSSCASGEESSGGFYRGQVLDTDTGKPLEGVLVVFIWYRDVYSATTKQITDEFHAATEILTDAHGRFEVPRSPETTLGPSVVHIQSPGVIFFAPGYVLARFEVDPGVRRFRDPTRIYMQRAAKPADGLELHLVPSFPYSRTPSLLKALNKERARLGLPMIQAGNEGEER